MGLHFNFYGVLECDIRNTNKIYVDVGRKVMNELKFYIYCDTIDTNENLSNTPVEQEYLKYRSL